MTSCAAARKARAALTAGSARSGSFVRRWRDDPKRIHCSPVFQELRNDHCNRIEFCGFLSVKQNIVETLQGRYDSGPFCVEVGASSSLRLRWLIDRKSKRLNSSHANISYAVF